MSTCLGNVSYKTPLIKHEVMFTVWSWQEWNFKLANIVRHTDLQRVYSCLKKITVSILNVVTDGWHSSFAVGRGFCIDYVVEHIATSVLIQIMKLIVMLLLYPVWQDLGRGLQQPRMVQSPGMQMLQRIHGCLLRTANRWVQRSILNLLSKISLRQNKHNN